MVATLSPSTPDPPTFNLFAFVVAKKLYCASDTPHNSIKAEVPYRILDIYGDAASNGSNKYLVQLRDPVTRAISSWQRKFDREICAWGGGRGDVPGVARDQLCD